MKTFTIADIRSWKPCYDPSNHLPEDWSGTVLDILNHETVSPQDKLWVVCREDLIDAKTLRLFAVWCARQVEHLMTEDRSKQALDVAERFVHGKLTHEALAAARADAYAAARAARADNITADAAAAYADAYAAARAARVVAAAARAAQIAQLIKMVQE